MKETTPEHAGIVVGKVAAYSGAATAVASGGLSLNDWGVIIGIAGVVFGLLFGQYWSWRKVTREERESQERRAERARQEERDVIAHVAYLRRLERDVTPTAPAPLMCANDETERRA